MWLATLWWRTGDALENRQSVFLGIFIRQPPEKNDGCVGLRTKKKTPPLMWWHPPIEEQSKRGNCMCAHTRRFLSRYSLGVLTTGIWTCSPRRILSLSICLGFLFCFFFSLKLPGFRPGISLGLLHANHHCWCYSTSNHVSQSNKSPPINYI